jgi:hypothetical protein
MAKYACMAVVASSEESSSCCYRSASSWFLGNILDIIVGDIGDGIVFLGVWAVIVYTMLSLIFFFASPPFLGVYI